ncbi:MAG: 30S ribosome-binding factor RbfA [Candidatus Harrisonbacteria bacterium]|nr:30S ribosome-binding factor RbfA [Candidatus Harrisonbacteria bacterium]MBI2405970.1 30S ribosome-binding factor RbfA [Candidatus Harrisonbacteria bacterium]MBI2603955.1 30S ribosome-binding factor RbfA [Candidatus Harrisonbacteria bacterium]
MKFHRKERIGELIRDELSNFFLRELEFPGKVLTITSVEVSGDLTHAKVKVSILPSGGEADILKKLIKMRGHFQHLLNYKLNIRPMPEIRFEIDYGLEKAAIIERDLLEVEKDEKKR